MLLRACVQAAGDGGNSETGELMSAGTDADWGMYGLNGVVVDSVGDAVLCLF